MNFRFTWWRCWRNPWSPNIDMTFRIRMQNCSTRRWFGIHNDRNSINIDFRFRSCLLWRWSAWSDNSFQISSLIFEKIRMVWPIIQFTALIRSGYQKTFIRWFLRRRQNKFFFGFSALNGYQIFQNHAQVHSRHTN